MKEMNDIHKRVGRDLRLADRKAKKNGKAIMSGDFEVYNRVRNFFQKTYKGKRADDLLLFFIKEIFVNHNQKDEVNKKNPEIIKEVVKDILEIDARNNENMPSSGITSCFTSFIKEISDEGQLKTAKEALCSGVAYYAQGKSPHCDPSKGQLPEYLFALSRKHASLATSNAMADEVIRHLGPQQTRKCMQKFEYPINKQYLKDALKESSVQVVANGETAGGILAKLGLRKRGKQANI